jgi:hypothetical protein
MAPAAQAGQNDFIVLLSMVMTATYLVQGAFAILHASRHQIGNLSLLRRTFGGGEAFSRTWLATIAILAIPFLLSWVPTVPHMHTSVAAEQRAIDVAAYYGCVAIITVLITVELTLLFDLRNEGRRWQGMLVVALGLDVVSLFIFTTHIGHPRDWSTLSSTWTWVYMLVAGCSALASSFVIVLLSKSANEYVVDGAAPNGQAVPHAPVI